MARQTADAVIVGGGILGCSIALELSRRGFEPVVVEKESSVGQGSTSASSACVRQHYSNRAAVALALEGVRIWKDWQNYIGVFDEEDSPPAEYREVGCLIVLEPSISESMRKNVAMMQEVGVDASILPIEELRRRWPYLSFHARTDTSGDTSHLPDIEGAVWEPESGYVTDPRLATKNLMYAAQKQGARVLLNSQVVEVLSEFTGEEDRKVVGVKLNRGAGIDKLHAPTVINAAGPHSHVVNLRARCPLPITTAPARHEVINVPIAQKWDFEARPLPICGNVIDGIYFRPEPGENAIHVGSLAERDEYDYLVDPDQFNRNASVKFWEEKGSLLMSRFGKAGLGSRPRGLADLYDVTVADWYPIIDATDLQGYYVAIGTSGAWFKAGPVIGRMMAELVEACSSGRNHDEDPVKLRLPRSGNVIDLSFFSRNRRPINALLGGGVLG